MADTKKQPGNSQTKVFTQKEIDALKEKLDPRIVEATAPFMSAEYMAAIIRATAVLDHQSKAPMARRFALADLKKREHEAQIVAADVGIFQGIAKLVNQTVGLQKNMLSAGNVEGAQVLANTLDAAGRVAQASADKEGHMGGGGSGDEGGGHDGTTTTPGDGTTTTPEEETDCYEQYRRDIKLSHRNLQGDELVDAVVTAILKLANCVNVSIFIPEMWEIVKETLKKLPDIAGDVIAQLLTKGK